MADNKLTRILQGALNMVPGYPSLNGLINKKNYGIRQALYDLQNQIVPFNGAYQDWLNDRPQDWNRNAIEAALIFAPYAKGVGKKMASSLGDVTGKGGFIYVKPGSSKLKDIIESSNESGHTITAEMDKEIRDHVGLMNKFVRGQVPGKQLNNHYDRMATESKQVIDTYYGMQRLGRETPKPEGFDAWPAADRARYIEDKVNIVGMDPEELYQQAMLKKDKEYGRRDIGSIYSDFINLDDYNRARYELEQEAKERAAQIQMPEFVEEAYNAQPIAAQDIVNPRGPQNRYDHSRQFEDTALKEMPAVDRSGAKYYEDTDPLYDIYKIWREHPEISGDEGGSKIANILNKELGRADRSKPSNILALSPFEAAGVINDANVSLWNKIKALRDEGMNDTQIREILADDLNKYQGMLERYKARRDADRAQFEYDGARTNYLVGSPSEKARASQAATVDTPDYAELDLLTKFYSDILKNRK